MFPCGTDNNRQLCPPRRNIVLLCEHCSLSRHLQAQEVERSQVSYCLRIQRPGREGPQGLQVQLRYAAAVHSHHIPILANFPASHLQPSARTTTTPRTRSPSSEPSSLVACAILSPRRALVRPGSLPVLPTSSATPATMVPRGASRQFILDHLASLAIDVQLTVSCRGGIVGSLVDAVLKLTALYTSFGFAMGW